MPKCCLLSQNTRIQLEQMVKLRGRKRDGERDKQGQQPRLPGGGDGPVSEAGTERCTYHRCRVLWVPRNWQVPVSRPSSSWVGGACQKVLSQSAQWFSVRSQECS